MQTVKTLVGLLEAQTQLAPNQRSVSSLDNLIHAQAIRVRSRVLEFVLHNLDLFCNPIPKFPRPKFPHTKTVREAIREIEDGE